MPIFLIGNQKEFTLLSQKDKLFVVWGHIPVVLECKTRLGNLVTLSQHENLRKGLGMWLNGKALSSIPTHTEGLVFPRSKESSLDGINVVFCRALHCLHFLLCSSALKATV